jgi:salicylate hydroxylase
VVVGVIGGGLGGLCVALTLARGGHEAVVLEQAASFGEIGAGIQLGPNATAILDELGVLERLAGRAVVPGSLRLLNAVTGREITSVDLGAAFAERYGAPYIVLHRADLLDSLIDACRDEPRVSLASSREVVSIEDEGSEVRLTSADGWSQAFDCVVGADGLWSRTRGHIVGDEPVRVPHVAYRSTGPVAQLPEVADLSDVLMWIGPGFHFVQYRLRGGDILNQVAVFHVSPLPGSTAETGSPEQLAERFAVACDPIQRGLTLINRDRHWEMHERPRISEWSRGRVTLLGDAAHAMLQYVAQGACQAFEDAAVLGRELERHGTDVERAFRAYTDERAPRTARVQDAARNWGEICHLDGIASELRDRFLGARAADEYDQIDWLYGYRVQPAPAGIGAGRSFH